MLTHIDVDIASELSFGLGTDADPEETDYPHAFEFVHDEFEGTGRWDIHHTITFRYDGQLYEFGYAEPATEYQEHSFEERFEAVPVPVYPVEAHEVMTTVYKRVKT